jgi:hypothetical protein
MRCSSLISADEGEPAHASGISQRATAKEMIMRKAFLICTMVLSVFGFPLATTALGATQTLEITKNNILGKTGFSLSFALSGARMVIRRINDDDIIVRAAITYNTGQWELKEPKLFTESSGSTLIAEFRSGMRVLPYTNTNLEEWDISIGNYDVATALSIVCSNTAADLNLGGLPLTRCNLKLIKGTFELDFDAPTTRPVEQFTINGRAMNLAVSNIGNTDFGFFSLTGSGGTADLSFDGLYEAEEHNVQIATAGMIEIITVPSDAGEQVVLLPFSLPVVVVPRDEWKRDYWFPFLQRYTTNDYNTRNIKINLGLILIGSFGTVVRESD